MVQFSTICRLSIETAFVEETFQNCVRTAPTRCQKLDHLVVDHRRVHQGHFPGESRLGRAPSGENGQNGPIGGLLVAVLLHVVRVHRADRVVSP